jgi:hypothetical protein
MRHAITANAVARAFQNPEPEGITHTVASAEHIVASFTAKAIAGEDEGTDSEVSV